MKTTVIYHSADFDGIFCREIARKFLPPDTEFIGWNFGDEPLKIPQGKFIVMDLPLDRVFGFTQIAYHELDVCFMNSDAKELKRVAVYNVIWIDHHKSAIESHPKDIPGYRVDGVSACRLAWQWFTLHHEWDPREQHPPYDLPAKQDFIDRKVNEPLAVRLAGEYDIHDDRMKTQGDIELFQFALKSQEIGPGDWNQMLSTVSPTPEEFGASESELIVEFLLHQATPIKFARDQEYKDVITEQGFDLKFEGLNFLACCSHEADIRSQLFEAGIKAHHDALLGFTFTGKKWRFSLYQIDGKKDVDVLKIAKKFNGGGHAGACGFINDTLPWTTNPMPDLDIVIDYLESTIPERNCNCHSQPPCSWCVENGGIYEELKTMREIKASK